MYECIHVLTSFPLYVYVRGQHTPTDQLTWSCTNGSHYLAHMPILTIDTSKCSPEYLLPYSQITSVFH